MTTPPTASSPRWPGRSTRRTTPNHRALSDARATVDVLHGLMERLGGLGVHTLEELQTFSLAGQHRPAQEAPPRRGAAALPRRLPLPGRPLPRPLRRHLPRPAHPRPLLLHRLRDPVADGRDGRPGHLGHRHRVRHPARGRGARAAADRRAQAALQPPLPVPGEGALRQADPRAVAAAVAGAAGARRRRRLPRPVLLQEDRREVPGRAARHVPGAPVLRPARPSSRPGRRACSPRWAAASRRATAAPTPRRTPPSCAGCATPCCAAPTTSSRPSTSGCRCWPPTSASRRPASTATGCPRSSAPPPAPSGSRALTRCPEVVAARREDDGRWAVHVVRHGRLAAAGVIPPGADAHQFVAELAASAETVARRPGPGAGGDRRGDREGAALARVARRPAGRRRRRVDLPGRRRHPPPRPPRRRQPRPGSRWSRSTTGATCATGPPAGPLVCRP